MKFFQSNQIKLTFSTKVSRKNGNIVKNKAMTNFRESSFKKGEPRALNFFTLFPLLILHYWYLSSNGVLDSVITLLILYIEPTYLSDGFIVNDKFAVVEAI